MGGRLGLYSLLNDRTESNNKAKESEPQGSGPHYLTVRGRQHGRGRLGLCRPCLCESLQCRKPARVDDTSPSVHHLWSDINRDGHGDGLVQGEFAVVKHYLERE